MAGTTLERGREAYTVGSWRIAFDLLSEVQQSGGLSAEDLELLARSAYMLGRDEEYVDALVLAHQARLTEGDTARAVRCAVWIGHNLLFRGNATHAGGWFARAQRLLDRVESDCVERGYILIPLWLEQIGRGDYEAGLATAAQGEAIGERFHDEDLLWLARDDQARALLRMGRVEEGLRLVEEILVATDVGELSAFATGILYCNTIAFCRDAYELRHVREWTSALTRWCERQPEMIAHNGLCLVHRAELMLLMGAWQEALEELAQVIERFNQGVMNQIAYGQAHYRRGEIYRLRGDFAEAEDAYREASRSGFEPLPGVALLRLLQGNQSTASAAIRRAIGETTEPLARVPLLAAYVEIMLAVGDSEAARTAAHELEQIADSRQNDVLIAISAHARGASLLADGDAHQALVALRRAMSLWHGLGASYELARVRVLLASACDVVGDTDAAALELEAARDAFETLGARPALAGTAAALPSNTEDVPTHGLTDREVVVLRLVARGQSNREIAIELVISEHTVARHVQNIFAKLGVSSRGAAGAFAFEHDLI